VGTLPHDADVGIRGRGTSLAEAFEQAAYALTFIVTDAEIIAAGPSQFTLAQSTAHLTTNAWTIEQFGIAKVTITQRDLTHVKVEPSEPHFRTY
jgi:SHS2 domain-containing protein